jgi:hypothetical protein
MSRLWRRWRAEPLRWTLFTIAAGTLLSGLFLIVAQAVVLNTDRQATASSSESSVCSWPWWGEC